MAFSFSCIPAFAKVCPMKPSSKEGDEPFSNPKAKEEGKEKKKQEKEVNKEKHQGRKKKSNLDQAASMAPYFPFHSRPGLR
ncbi:hypothetical protein COCNU_15G003480 [Cocos nucifera]|uniref:Uncharacterized protein n=1 Tax=Cocos nucifera TaxID=13894 RepID=A0A8K0IX96_COCNU|nr:hypothetical protein COCNU_15G003470 [Cocos nucifera]KAG1369982.1 hypothetical protein COCNU_15G003480 [Cocos nucifera]